MNGKKDQFCLYFYLFLQECPSGVVTEREFQTIYSHFFPHGNCENYTSFLFRVLDRRKRMYFTFEVIS
jgi:Ca2+-binding EF-hand superfamily protein